MSKVTRTNAILPYVTWSDYSDKIGCALEVSSGSIPKVSLWEPGASRVFGVIIEADAERASVAILHGGVSGTVKLKLLEETEIGDLLYPAKDNQDFGFGVVQNETYSGSSYICAQALEDGVAGEMIEAVLFRPEAFTIA